MKANIKHTTAQAVVDKWRRMVFQCGNSSSTEPAN